MFIKLIAYLTVCPPVLILAFFVGLTDAQILQLDDREYSAGLMPVQDAAQPVFDYFDAAKERSLQQRLANIERFHMQPALESIRNGKYQPALGDLKFALRYFPNHPRALQLVTAIAALTKNRALPVPYFEKAIALFPGHAITHAQYGWYLVTIGERENGIQKLEHAIEIDPKLTAGHVWLAHAYEKKGDFEMARLARDRATKLGYKGNLSGDPTK